MRAEIDWLQGLRRYIVVVGTGNLIWEAAQLPLYTVWTDGTPRDRLVAVLHCTAGDFLIALCAWAFAVGVTGRPSWPAETAGRVAFLTIASGLAYTGYSEWYNTVVRSSWTYSELMPVVTGLGVGLSPALQWLVIPAVALWIAGRSRPCQAEFAP